MSNTPFEWTPEIIVKLSALWKEGLSTSLIGERLGITKNAVVGKVHRLGLPKRGSPIKQAAPKKVTKITLADLRPSMCCWPDGEPSTEEFQFCGKPITPDKPYCPEHCERAYVKTTRDGRKIVPQNRPHNRPQILPNRT